MRKYLSSNAMDREELRLSACKILIGIISVELLYTANLVFAINS